MNTNPFERENVPTCTIPPREFSPKSAKIGSLRPFSTIFTLSSRHESYPKTAQYRYLFRQIRHKIANIAGKSRTDRTGIGRKDGNSPENALQLGVRSPAATTRCLSDARRITCNQGSDALAGVLKKEFSKTFPKRETPLLTFPVSGIKMSSVTSRTVHGVARQLTETKNTSQNLPPRRDTRPVRAGSLFVNHVEVML